MSPGAQSSPFTARPIWACLTARPSSACTCPEHFWRDNALEFYKPVQFYQGGLVYADFITTVSSHLRRGNLRIPGGMGLEGLLSQRRERLVGILNGIDSRVWDPSSDPPRAALRADSLADKALNKVALQASLGLAAVDDRPLVGLVGRLVEQRDWN